MTASRDLIGPQRLRETGVLEQGLKEPIYENIEIPEHFGPVEIVIDDLKIKRFAFVTDDYGDWYLRSGPSGPRIGQPGLLANDLLQLFTTRYAASQVVGLHTSEELWWEHPVEIGQIVTLEGDYTEKYEQRGQGSVVMEAGATDEAGRVLVRHRGIEIMRTRPAEVGGRGAATAPHGPRVTGEYDQTRPLVDTLDIGIEPGTGLVPIPKEVTFEQMAVFSRLGEFVRNIHNDLETARAAGLELPILQGQQQVCYLAQLCARSFGTRWFTGGSLKVKFLRPISSLQTIELGGVVRAVEDDGSGPEAHLDLWIKDANSRMTTVGWARGPLGPSRGVT